MTINDVLPKLKGVKRTKPGHWMARCPAHDDRSPSLSVSEAADGKVLVHCFTGCSFESIVSALGIDRQYPRPPVPFKPIRKAIEDKPLDAEPMWRRWFKGTDYQLLDGLGMSLGVDTDCLKAIGCAWAGKEWQLDKAKAAWATPAWAFPMRAARGRVVGIRLRTDSGAKWSVKGGLNALFIPSDYSYLDTGDLFIVEGPTDLAAAMTIGLRAIARPTCSACDRMVIEYVQRNGIKRAVIVSDNDQEDKNGNVPGVRGAEKLQQALPIPSCVWVPPTKDIREFVNLGGDYRTMQACVKDLVWTRARRAA